MDWKSEKRNCDRDARLHAEGGEDQTELYQRRGMIDRYRKVYRERREQIEAAEAREARLAPLQRISSQAEALGCRSDNSEVREVCDMIRELADYLAEKENG